MRKPHLTARRNVSVVMDYQEPIESKIILDLIHNYKAAADRCQSPQMKQVMLISICRLGALIVVTDDHDARVSSHARSIDVLPAQALESQHKPSDAQP